MRLTATATCLTSSEQGLRALYNDRAGGYREGSGKVAWIGPEILAAKLKPLVVQKDGSGFTGLDLGAGTGEVGSRIKAIHSGAFITGIDLSEEMLALALADGFVDTARQGSVTDLSWVPDASQDLITACGVFDHLSPDAIPGLAAEIVRVAKPGAAIGFTFEAAGTQNPGPKANTRFDVSSLTGQFHAVGVNIIDIETILPAWFLGASRRPVENRIFVGQVPELSL